MHPTHFATGIEKELAEAAEKAEKAVQSAHNGFLLHPGDLGASQFLDGSSWRL